MHQLATLPLTRRLNPVETGFVIRHRVQRRSPVCGVQLGPNCPLLLPARCRVCIKRAGAEAVVISAADFACGTLSRHVCILESDARWPIGNLLPPLIRVGCAICICSGSFEPSGVDVVATTRPVQSCRTYATEFSFRRVTVERPLALCAPGLLPLPLRRCRRQPVLRHVVSPRFDRPASPRALRP
jgi:hypothetical protein